MTRALLCTASATAWAQGAEGVRLVGPQEALPPRFVLCQREVSQEAGERAKLMRTCLARRLEGERVVQRDCKRQASAVKGPQARQSATLDCERQALSVVSSALPRGAAPAPRPVAMTAAAPRPAQPTPDKRPTVIAAPAAGEN